MIKYLKKRGNSHSITIERSLMELMRIDESTPIEVELTGRTLTLRPADDSKVEEAASRISKRYNRAMKRLAK